MKRLAIVLMLVCLAVASCGGWDDSSQGNLTILRADGTEAHFNVEIADTQETLTMGLMFRQSLPKNAGMLFLFQQEGPRAFWMKNTYIPLDMIFIRRDGVIVNIAERAIPHDMTPHPSIEPAIAVLEINGGRAAELGIRAGDIVQHARLNNGLAEPAPID